VAALLVLLLFLPSQHRKAKTVAIVSVLTLLVTIVVLYFTVPSVTIVVAATLLDKTASGSALERALIVYNDLEYFLQYPLLGIGWDCAPTHDLIIGMLANCGVLGLSAFFTLIGTVIYKLRALFRSPAKAGIAITPSIMMFLCLSVTCIVYTISGGIEPPDFWVILGLSIAASGIGYKQNEGVSRT
jgi:O-antigen ligase